MTLEPLLFGTQLREEAPVVEGQMEGITFNLEENQEGFCQNTAEYYRNRGHTINQLSNQWSYYQTVFNFWWILSECYRTTIKTLSNNYQITLLL